MASVIRIKRSGTTGSPSTLAQGEFAYSFLDGTLSNGGDRLYIGTGTEITPGVAANIEVIGGKYFTSKLDHTPGILTANSAIIVDDNKSIDELFFDNNLNISGNSITTANGDLTIDPAGSLIIDSDVTITGTLNITGEVELTGNTTVDNLSVNSLTENRVVYVGTNGLLIDSSNFTFDGSNVSIIGELNVDNLKLDGNTLSSTNENGDIVLNPNGTGKVDVSSSVITGVSNPSANTDAVNLQFLNTIAFTAAADAGTANNVLATSGTLTIAGGTALSSAVTGAAGSATITINLDNTSVVAGSYGSSIKIPTFTVDAQGRLTAAGEADVATTLNFEGDTGAGAIDLLIDTLNVIGGTGVSTDASSNTLIISIGQDVSTSADVTFNDGTFTGDLIVSGDFTVNGNTTIVNTQTLEVEDPLIKLARGNATDTVSIGFYGEYDGNLKSGFFRSHEDGAFYLFRDLNENITDTNVIDLNGLQLADANFADVYLANISASANVDVIGTVSAGLFVGEIDGGSY